MMAVENVQEYLQKHKIGPLFEDLMAKVISDKPDDPCMYLSRILQMRSGAKNALRKSASGDFAAAMKGSDKSRPTNSKRTPGSLSKSTGSRTVGARPDWDPKTKVDVVSSLDDIWQDSEKLKLKKSQERRPPSPTKRGAAAWMDSNLDEGEDVMFSVYGYRGPHKGRRESDDPLTGELGLMKTTTFKSSEPVMSKRNVKKGIRGKNAAQHKANLQEYVKAVEIKIDSGFEEDSNDYDDAIELLEDADDLRREGVRNVKSSGVRMSKTNRRSNSTTPDVRVSICATCAKVMSGGVPSQPAAAVKFEADTDYDYNTELDQKTERSNRDTFNVLNTASDDDEFESVSQVTGPRRPVWQESTNDALTPRKGRNMLTSNLSPSKGLPMYSNTTGGSRREHRAQSEEFFQPDVTDADQLRKTWSPMDITGGDYTKRTATARSATTSRSKRDVDEERSPLEGNNEGWQVPPDYDTDSSFYGSPGATQPQRVDRAY